MIEHKEIKRILLELEVVLADFQTGASKLAGVNITPDSAGHKLYDARKEELTNKRLFRNLPPMVDMYDLIAYVRHTGTPWEILTAAGEVNRELCVYDKNEWIREFVDPTIAVTCTFTGSQKGMYAFEGSVLIDDRQKNIDHWIENGGIGIVHTSAENTINELKLLRNGVGGE